MKEKKIRKAVIPAAGLGTRGLPATKAQPKEMLVVVDKPALQYLVEELVDSGIEEILIVTGRNKTSIENHFDYSFELEKTLEENGKKELLKVVNDISIQSIQKVIITTLLPFLAFYSFLQNAGKEDVKTFGVVFGLSAIYYFLLTTIALI